jgi:hypothetical protein
MLNLAKGILMLAIGACPALGACASYAAAAGNPHGDAVHHASRVPAAALEPNRWVLTGSGLQVTYSSTGLVGQPQFTYHDKRQTRQFSGPQIRRVDTDAGTLVSVTTVMTVDTGSATFSLLLPRVTLRNGQPTPIHTLGITTSHRLTIDTPAHGQLDTYQFHNLTGTATFVVF